MKHQTVQSVLFVFWIITLPHWVHAQSGEELRLPKEPPPNRVPEPDRRPFSLNPPSRSIREAPPQTSRVPLRVSSQSLINTIEQIEFDQSRRIRRIQEKLDRLRKLAEACKKISEKAKQPVEAVVPQPASPQLPSILPPPQKPETQPAPPLTAPPPQPSTIPVSLTKTVDQLALANNLFAQGKAADARPIYEDLIGAPQSASDLVWIQYQLAACYRLEGRIKESRRLYRIVASAKGEEYWTSQAHWWLDYLDRSAALRDRQQGIQAKLDELRKQTDELRKQ